MCRSGFKTAIYISSSHTFRYSFEIWSRNVCVGFLTPEIACESNSNNLWILQRRNFVDRSPESLLFGFIWWRRIIMKLHSDGILGIFAFSFDFFHTQAVFTSDPILPWEKQIMEISGVTFWMASSSIAVKENSKLCNSRAIDMFFFKLYLVWRVQNQDRFCGKRYRHNKVLYLILI